MKLKNLIYNVSLGAVGLMFVACSDISEDDRFIFVEPAEVAKRVLIEDFTGQRCVNCPDVAKTIEQLMDDYGSENIIAVGLYGGSMGYLPNGGPEMPLTCDEAQWYYDFFKITGQPSVKVDRGSTSQNIGEWPTQVHDRIQQQSPVILNASCVYYEASRNLEIKVSADGIQNVNGKLLVWLTEDSIVSSQIKYDENRNAVTDTKYVHNHVFRATVNVPEGEDISVAENENVTRTFTYTLKGTYTQDENKKREDWKPENMSVVAFIFDDSGVLQAVKAPLIPKSSDEAVEDSQGD